MITSALTMVAALALWQRWAPRPTRGSLTTRTDRRAAATTDWADVADAIGHAVRAGHSLRAAYQRVLDERAPDGRVVRRGTTLDDVVAAHTADPDELVVVRALQTAWRLGGPAAAGLHTAAALLRERRALRAEASAHSAQARASARVLTLVPVVFAALGATTSSSFRSVVGSPAGAAVIAGGAVLNLIGWWWMRRAVGGVAS